MQTLVRTPQDVFLAPQLLQVPLFQRPYVWNRESQWEPLWRDVVRVAERRLTEPSMSAPHFLGAVVLQQQSKPVGSLQAWSIVDGQQRLTTLQLLLDALHAELVAVDAEAPAQRLEDLIANRPAYCKRPSDRFKVWPTNRDRPAFERVMAAESPIDYDTIDGKDERLVQAHRFFSEQAREWLALNGVEDIPARAEAIDHAVRELMQLVVIDLRADENAQEIFETLNARGTPLTAADLIKNLVFQRLQEQDEDVEAVYQQHWREFETGFWETDIVFGRLHYSRSSIFLNHWLIARTGEEIVAREVFGRFKRFAEDGAPTSMVDLVEQIHRASRVYREFIDGATAMNPIDRLQLFAYRSSVLESEVFKPVVLWLYDPEQSVIADDQLRKALDVLESWLVRRMLVRASTKSYTQIAAELVTQLSKSDRAQAGDVVEQFFADQRVDSRVWPDDRDVRHALADLPAYRRLRRGRLRMVLEAVEDHLRGFVGTHVGLGGERVPRGSLHIEHVMPRKWQAHWPIEGDAAVEQDRDHLVHTLGNLTLLTGRLNTKVSHGSWTTKRPALAQHDVLKINSELLARAGDRWDDDRIAERTAWMVSILLKIWPVPDGHTSGMSTSRRRRGRRRVGIADLIGAGLLDAGAVLRPRPKALRDRIATVLADGTIDIDGAAFRTPSGAAKSMIGREVNGWRFFVVEASGERLSELWESYVEQTSADVEDELDVDDDEDDEELDPV